MKSSLLPLTLLALALTACSSTRETVVERPVVSHETREIIVEKPAVTHEIVVEKPVVLPRSCAYGLNTYSSSSLSCQGGYQYQCIDGAWASRSLTC